MATPRPKSPKERRDAKNARSFIGRTEQQDWFTRSLLQPEHQTAKLIFSISGQGGVGKTTLLREFRRIAEGYGHVVAYVDEGVATNRVDDVPEAMHRLAEDLEGQGFKFEKFRERYKAYRVKKQEMEADPEAPRGFVGDATRGVMKIALEAGKSAVPFGSMVDSDMLASKAGELMNYGVERFRNKDEERLIKETLEVLTPLFLEGVKCIPKEKTLVLMLDTYEVTGGFLDGWVRGVLEEDYGVPERSLLLCIGGRDPIDKNAWTEWEGMIARSPLEPFTKEEALEFLASQQIKSGAVIEEIWRLSSGGLPLLVSMMASAAPTSADAVVDPCEDAVNRFLVWETHGARRDLAQDGACARVLNADVVAALGEGSFEWLSGCAFVLREGARWRYHLVVREQMLRYLGQRSPKRSAEVHRKLAIYYDGLRSGLGLELGKEVEDKTWREHSLEWIYHELSAAPQAKLGAALNGFLIGLKHGARFAQAWAEVMVQVGRETNCETLRKWGDRLRDGMEAREEKRYEDAILCLTALVVEKLVTGPMKAVAFDRRSSLYQQSDRQELALQDALKAVELDGESDRCHFRLAFTYQILKRHEESIEAYQRTIDLNPKSDPVYGNLGVIYKAQKRYEEAIVAYERAIDLNPDLKQAVANRGEVYRLTQRNEEALKDFDRAIELDSKYVWAILCRGQTYQTLKRYEEALKDFDRAIELDSEYSWAIVSRGQTHRALKRYEEALQDFDRAIEIDSEYSWAIASRGQTYQALKRYEEALKDFDRAIEIEPTTWKLSQRGQTYRSLKRYEEALKDFDRAIEIDREYVWAIICRGQTYQTLKRYEEALKDFDRAIEIEPTAWRLSQRGQTYRSLKRYEEALKDFDRAIEIDSEYSRAIASRGQTYQALKRYEEALKDFDRAIELDSEYSRAIWKRGDIYLQIDQTEKAITDFDRAIKLAPEVEWNYYLRAIAHFKLNQPELAKTDFQRAITISTSNYEKDPIDWQNNFNLALYYLAAGQVGESRRLYDRSSEASTDMIEMAIRDLDDYLTLFPDRLQAREVREELRMQN